MGTAIFWSVIVLLLLFWIYQEDSRSSKSLLGVVTVSVLLLATANAQSPSVHNRFKLFNSSDAVYWGGAGADLASSLNKREGNPLWRDQNGIFAPGKNLAFKGIVWGGFKLLESRYSSPNERRAIAWVKYGVGAAFVCIAAHNLGVKQVR